MSELDDILRLSGVAEAKKPTKTADKTNTKIKFDSPTSKGEVQKASPKGASIKSNVKSKQGTQGTSFNAPRGAGSTMAKALANARDVTDPVDIDQEPTKGVGAVPTKPKLPGTDLVVPSKDLQMYNDLYKTMSWHRLKNTPGYRIMQIRGSFRPLFREKIGAELEDVIVTTTLDPSVELDDMKHLIGYIARYGQKDEEFSLDAFGIDPAEYHVDQAFVYNFEGQKFLILKERLHGQENYYVYSAPSGRGSGLQSSSPKLLK